MKPLKTGPPMFVHIATVGVSLLQNARRELKKEKPSEDELVSFIGKDPRRASAELNTIFPLLEENKQHQHRVYLLHSDTEEGRLCAGALEQFISGLGLRAHACCVEVKELGSPENFTRGLANLLEQVVNLIRRHYAEGDRVFVHASGGFKPETTMAFLAANLPTTGAPVFYVHESFREMIRLPALPVWPRKRRKFVELMNRMCQAREIYPEALQRMFGREVIEEAKRLGWIVEEGNRLKITPMGLLLWQRFERLGLYGSKPKPPQSIGGF